ncbi:DUF3349 domain-containing protein [Rhodococcus marinonascens]|uniref:DUF3349 domain-containing protein n=1 Tax=Rhodococcus marinonascens TaxID=38311 RepID=UPI00111472A2|nr:DUF3349 domain-containing protein [Rhodococcus marinonascens]
MPKSPLLRSVPDWLRAGYPEQIPVKDSLALPLDSDVDRVRSNPPTGGRPLGGPR